ncbi:hypothetical protein KFU94_13290 [Chloroflexi bacterium TSY]|nr:hypothetical protein [Chloroflexi bacterium TSY]
MTEFYHAAKAIDPYRLIVDNSACRGNLHVASDIEDFHYYKAIPDHADEWDEWVADFASRAEWAWAADYAHERRSDLPLIVSEFGNWGLPNPERLQENGQEPWWFETGHEWGQGIVYPHGMKQRFDFWHLDGVFGDFECFVRAHQHHMGLSLAYEIASMRQHDSIGGYVITEFTDVHWECNGLLDMQRNVKEGLDEFIQINQDQVVMIRPQQWSGAPGETLAVEIVASGVDGAETTGMLYWQTAHANGELAAPGGTIDVLLPEGSKTGVITLQVEWKENTTLVATGQVTLFCMTDAATTAAASLLTVVEDDELATALTQLGYHVVSDETNNQATDEINVIVSRRYTPELDAAVQQGARLLLIAGPSFDADEQNSSLPIGRVIARDGTIWQGDWATSFGWLKKQGPFAHIPGNPLLEMECAEIMPDAVIGGLPAWMWRTQSWAGLALGWVHKPVSSLAQIPHGQGNLVVTTFNLTPTLLTEDVMAQSFFAGMIELADQS